MTVPQNPHRWQFSAPAWLLSIVLHLGCFLLLAIAMRSIKAPTATEPARIAEIVLVQTDAQKRTRYFAPATEKEEIAASVDSTPSSSFAALPTAKSIENFAKDDVLPDKVPVALPGSAVAVETHVATNGSTRKSLPISSADEKLISEEATRLAAQRKQQGPTASVTIFGTSPSQGRSFVFVIDRSKSMGGEGLGALDAASLELSKGLNRLTSEHQFQIIAYNNKLHFLNERRLLPATDENKLSVRKFFTDLAAFGGTEHELALHSALRFKPDVVFWLTDGGDPDLNQGQLHVLKQQAGNHTIIHSIQFGFGPPQESDNFMMQVARQNRGVYHYVDMAL